MSSGFPQKSQGVQSFCLVAAKKTKSVFPARCTAHTGRLQEPCTGRFQHLGAAGRGREVSGTWGSLKMGHAAQSMIGMSFHTGNIWEKESGVQRVRKQ